LTRIIPDGNCDILFVEDKNQSYLVEFIKENDIDAGQRRVA
jgi:hypothetical protein